MLKYVDLTEREREEVAQEAAKFLQDMSDERSLQAQIKLMTAREPEKDSWCVLGAALIENWRAEGLPVHSKSSKALKEKRDRADLLCKSWRARESDALKRIEARRPRPGTPEPKRTALNSAAERFMSLHPAEANRYYFLHDLSTLHKDWEPFERLESALQANLREANRDVHGRRPPKYKLAALRACQDALVAWEELKSSALTQIE